MTLDQLTQQLLALKRRNQTPIPLIEMLDALLSLDPGLSAKQKRKRIVSAYLDKRQIGWTKSSSAIQERLNFIRIAWK